MTDLELLTLSMNEAKIHSKENPDKTYILFWDGINEYGIVPEESVKLFQSHYPANSLIAKYRNGERVTD